jgi:hypothetical protein
LIAFVVVFQEIPKISGSLMAFFLFSSTFMEIFFLKKVIFGHSQELEQERKQICVLILLLLFNHLCCHFWFSVNIHLCPGFQYNMLVELLQSKAHTAPLLCQELGRQKLVEGNRFIQSWPCGK